jgi:hypothetical protein
MPTALRRPEPVTVEAFDAFIEAQADTALFELVEGVIVMMTNPTEVHEQIAANIGAPLKLAMVHAAAAPIRAGCACRVPTIRARRTRRGRMWSSVAARSVRRTTLPTHWW